MQQQLEFPDGDTAPASAGGGHDFDALEGMARTLCATGEYRVARRFRRRDRYADPAGRVLRTALFVDTETTGLDAVTDAIIELAIVPFTYCEGDGSICEVGPAASWLEDPGRPIPPPVTDLTGITDAMVRGQRIDEVAVAGLLAGASLVIAHNARFDRPFVERRLRGFEALPWACSVNDIPWKAHGCGSSNLEYLLHQSCGEFFGAHRAADDCLAAIHLLATRTPKGGVPMRLLLESSRRVTVRLWAIASPFDSKELLKGRGYRWSGGEGGRPKAWYRDCAGEQADAEHAWLVEAVYAGRDPAVIRREVIDATTRYSSRAS
ncbi:MAG: 3'-5' exonuclease [Gemmatimonadaceae bacterium]